MPLASPVISFLKSFKLSHLDKGLVIANIGMGIAFFTLAWNSVQADNSIPNHKSIVFADILKRNDDINPIEVTATLTNTPTPSPTATPTPTSVPTHTPTPIPPTPTPTNTTIQTQSVSSSNEYLTALNNYRQKNGVGPLSWDETLGNFAQSRADHFNATGGMDNHAGFQAMMNDNGFEKMGFNSLGENSSWSDNIDPIYIIESLYANSSQHNQSQLSSDWSHVGIGKNGKATNFVFGGKKR